MGEWGVVGLFWWWGYFNSDFIFFFFKVDEGDSGNGSEGFRMLVLKKGFVVVVGFIFKF